MHWKHALPIFFAGMVSASLAYHAINLTALADDAQSRVHSADKIVSYALGWDLAREAAANLEADSVTVDAEAMVRGFQAAIKGSEPDYDARRMNLALIEFNDRVFDHLHAERMRHDPVYRAQAEANARAGEAFRKRFAALPDVQSTASGALYRVDRTGRGPSPKPGDFIIANYSIHLLDGTEIGRGDDAVIDTATMLEGGKELVQLMQVGDKWTIFIAPKGSDGRASRGVGAGPNEAIIAEVELLGITDQPDE